MIRDSKEDTTRRRQYEFEGRAWRDRSSLVAASPRHGPCGDEPDPDEGEPDDDEKDAEALRESQVVLELLRRERSIIVSEPVTPKLTRRFMAQILWLNSQSREPIKVYINTPGGSADDGFALFDVIRFVTAPVYTICVGLNASAGTLVLLGAPKERRLALPNARIMIHQPSGGARGRASDIEISAEEILKLRTRANELIAVETGRSVKQVEQDTDRDYWLTAEQAKEYGLVSKVVRSMAEIKDLDSRDGIPK